MCPRELPSNGPKIGEGVTWLCVHSLQTKQYLGYVARGLVIN